MSVSELLSRRTSVESALIDAGCQPVEHDLLSALWNADTCKAVFLPYLAWAMNVDSWSEIESYQRNAISNSFRRHKYAGSVAAVKSAVQSVAPEGAIVNIIEKPGITYQAGANYDGTRSYGESTSWATYALELVLGNFLDEGNVELVAINAITEAAQEAAPVRCKLMGVSVNGSYTEEVACGERIYAVAVKVGEASLVGECTVGEFYVGASPTSAVDVAGDISYNAEILYSGSDFYGLEMIYSE